MLDLATQLRAEQRADEFLGLALADEAMSEGKDELSALLRLEEDAGAAVVAMMMPSTLSEADEAEDAANESEADSMWSACLQSETDEPEIFNVNKQHADAPSPGPIEPLPLDDVVAGELSDDGPDEMMMMIMEDEEGPELQPQMDNLLMTAALGPIAQAQGVSTFGGLNALAAEVAGKKRRGRKPSLKPKAQAKPKRPPPSAAKARLRSYERRSRHKREVRPLE